VNDARDWVVMGLMGSGFIASWVWVFLHPSEGSYMVCLGATGTFGAIFHWLTVYDAKQEDAGGTH